jgi:hypothetical protein
MKQFAFVAPILALCASACIEGEPPSLSSEIAEIHKSYLIQAGATCHELAPGAEICRFCDTEGKNCTTFSCVDGECEQDVTASEQGVLDLWLEAEDAVLTSPMQAQGSSRASNGKGVLVPTSSTAPGGSVRFDLIIPAGGRQLYAWARVRTPSASSNGIRFRIDSAPSKPLELPVTGTAWTWARVRDTSTPPTTDSSFFLGQGAHTLRFNRDETGVQLDRIVLTTSATFVPEVQYVEAESLSRIAPMQVGGSVLATRYMWVPTGTTTAGGQFDWQVLVGSDSFHSVWARYNAPSSSQNSFYSTADFSPQARWDVPLTAANDWAWAPVTSYDDGGAPINPYFYAGYHVISILRREAGAKIDSMVVTNDPFFVPTNDPPIVIQP